MSDASWILVVDDDDDIREMIVLLLGLEGHQGMGARDGMDALERIRERGRPSMIFLDLRMPRMSGPDFAAALRRDPALADIPIVVLSGDVTAIELAPSVGAVQCLRKPVDLADLLAVLANHASGA